MASVQFVEARPPIATKVAHHTTQERLAIRLSRELQSPRSAFPTTFHVRTPYCNPGRCSAPRRAIPEGLVAEAHDGALSRCFRRALTGHVPHGCLEQQCHWMARVQLDTVSCLFDCAVRVPRRHEGEAELDACLRVRGSTSTAAHI